MMAGFNNGLAHLDGSGSDGSISQNDFQARNEGAYEGDCVKASFGTGPTGHGRSVDIFLQSKATVGQKGAQIGNRVTNQFLWGQNAFGITVAELIK